MSLLTSTVMERIPPVDPFRIHLESLELAGKVLEKHMVADNSIPTFLDITEINATGGPTVSGQADPHYPNIPGISDVKLMSTLSKLPLPPEVMEHFGHMQCRCNMGLFTEISRAWLTIDTDIYVWTYEHGSDVAYFDGVGETIVSVGLAKPKPGIFNNFVRYLLVLTTTVEVVVLGVTFSNTKEGPLGVLEEMHLIPDPVFVVPTDGVTMTTTTCTESGRIFMGGVDGNLYEIVYQAESGWFGKRCKKVNHSTGTLSFLVPSFVSYAFTEEDQIVQISVDNSRNILYTLSEKGTVTVYDLGSDGKSMRRITSVSQNTIVQCAFQLVKTLDVSVFRPIVCVCPVEASESPYLNFVLVTQTGVRMYYTTSGVLNPPSLRPYTAELLHVRLPPGFAANSLPNRPSNVHMATYKKGTLVLVSSPGGDKDMVWCLNNDLYPFQSHIADLQTVLTLDGTAWALEEVKGQDAQAFLTCLKNTSQHSVPIASSMSVPSQPIMVADPPLMVRQHMEPPRKYIAFTSQGIEILLKLRPVDVLKQLLLDSHGPDGPAVQRFFKEIREDQACACALILACQDSTQNGQIVDWASRAFFLYGGEPKNLVENPTNPAASTSFQYSMQGGFNPTTVSTPVHGAQIPQPRNLNQQSFSSPQSFGGNVSMHGYTTPYSPRTPQSPAQAALSTSICSNLTREDCVWILGHLHTLQSFLNKNGPFSLLNAQGLSRRVEETPSQSRSRYTSRDALQEEKRSLDAFKGFVTHTCEVLGLWKILCEHQFHVVADALTKDHQNQLLAASFRNLILVGHELCSVLLTALINSYLNDNASVDSIIAKLREVCPHLYRTEDAACSKAYRMIQSAKATQNQEEKLAKLSCALQLCKEVAPHINLPYICQWFFQSQHYEGILELCVTCALKLDPKDMASHYYNNNEPAGDEEGYRAYVDRVQCYKEITSVLDLLHTQNDSAQLLKLVHAALATEDELLHVAIYDWMLNKNLLGDLAVATQPSYAKYLNRRCEQGQDSVQMNDLLWKYYEKNENHAAAAKILLKLATTQGDSVALTQRIAYLARAVMCMRSDKVGCAPHLGVFLRELEDKIEVARLQQQILDAINNKPASSRTGEAITKLNSGLLDITALYENFAEPFGLWESKLAIIHCSGHHDQGLIEHVWQNIIDSELQNSKLRNSDDRMALVLSKVKSLGEEYSLSPRCFPVAFLVQNLELQCCRLGAEKKQVYQLMLSLGVHLAKLIQIYDTIVSENDISWFKNGGEFYVIEVVAYLIDEFISNPRLVPSAEKRLIATKAGDLLTKCLTLLYTKPGSPLIERLQGVQARLNRFSNEL
ncbi:Nuclear pore complex protein Nup155 [Gryllus bimaculatus]|nr:Nuclear pore complex protein Nup155 [Gryllus bimaculatus]